MPPPNAGIWMTNERYDFLMNRAEIAESRLREAEKFLAELQECGEGMKRDLAFAKTRKRPKKRSIELLEILVRNHEDVTQRLEKALCGSEEEKHPLEATWVCEEEEEK